MPRITSSEISAGGGYRYNVQGIEPVIAIVTSGGPGIAVQGAVESLLFASAMAEGMVEEIEGRSEQSAPQTIEIRLGRTILHSDFNRLSRDPNNSRWQIEGNSGFSAESFSLDNLLTVWESKHDLEPTP